MALNRLIIGRTTMFAVALNMTNTTIIEANYRIAGTQEMVFVVVRIYVCICVYYLDKSMIFKLYYYEYFAAIFNEIRILIDS